jgi:hypothetical protein
MADVAMRLRVQPAHQCPSEEASVGWRDNGAVGMVGVGSSLLARHLR